MELTKPQATTEINLINREMFGADLALPPQSTEAEIPPSDPWAVTTTDLSPQAEAEDPDDESEDEELEDEDDEEDLEDDDESDYGDEPEPATNHLGLQPVADAPRGWFEASVF